MRENGEKGEEIRGKEDLFLLRECYLKFEVNGEKRMRIEIECPN